MNEAQHIHGKLGPKGTSADPGGGSHDCRLLGWQ